MIVWLSVDLDLIHGYSCGYPRTENNFMRLCELGVAIGS